MTADFADERRWKRHEFRICTTNLAKNSDLRPLPSDLCRLSSDLRPLSPSLVLFVPGPKVRNMTAWGEAHRVAPGKIQKTYFFSALNGRNKTTPIEIPKHRSTSLQDRPRTSDLCSLWSYGFTGANRDNRDTEKWGRKKGNRQGILTADFG